MMVRRQFEGTGCDWRMFLVSTTVMHAAGTTVHPEHDVASRQAS